MYSKLTLDEIFVSHMVFQANKPIRIWGEGEGDVEVTMNGCTVKAIYLAGRWVAELEPMTYGGPYTATVSLAGENIHIEDIYIGDVYLLAGQSNVRFKMYESTTPQQEWSENKMLRLFSTKQLDAEDPFCPDDGWVVGDKENIGNWPALGYLMGNILQCKKGVAIGLITCYHGMSVIESWVPEGFFEKNGIIVAPKDKSPTHTREKSITWNMPGALYNFNTRKLFPYSLAGVVWYQGESDAAGFGEAKVYDQEVALLIDCWREGFRDARLPFVVVQIADFDVKTGAELEAWKTLQRSQLNVENLRESVKTVVSADVCESNDIHPPTKKKLAERIAGCFY